MDTIGSTAEQDTRINRAIDHIEVHPGRDPRLDEIARVAGFSSYHFHRHFSARVGETVGRFSARLRLERAAARLLDRTGEPVTDMALDLGFASPSSFARAFRARFDMTATEWRRAGRGRRSNARGPRRGGVARPPRLARVETWDAFDVVYVRHVGPYAGDDALFGRLLDRLVTEAAPRGLISPGSRFVGLYHDPPGVTREEQLRLSIGLIVTAPDVGTMAPLQRLRVDRGRWAIASFELVGSEYEDAWDRTYAGWLPGSGYQPAHRPAIEVYRDDLASARPGGRWVDVCVPVEPVPRRFARRGKRAARRRHDGARPDRHTSGRRRAAHDHRSGLRPGRGVSHDHRPTLPAGAGGLEAFDHALALFWFHQLDAPRERSTLHIDSPYRFGPAWLGTFATRAPVRPNPIGITAIRLLDVDPASGRIRVPFIDALDQTPVLDIKPYVPALDRVRDVEPPAWCAHWPRWVEEAGTFDWAAEINPST